MSRGNILRLLPLLGYFAVHALAADTRIVRDNGVGPVKIGMTLAQLSSVLHEKLSKDESGTEGCFYAKSRGHDHIAFMIIDGRVARIDVDAPGVVTLSGLQVGDSEAHARKVYGPKLTLTAHQYVETGHYLTVRSDDPCYGVRFETDNGKITMYYAGNYDAIQYVEGCE
jgi:hypothetical protein